MPLSLKVRKDRARLIREVLESHYPDPKPPLDSRNPFTFLVAVALSAQTTDARVNRVTPALFDEADSPGKMASLGASRILHHIKTCGLAPTKAKNIEKLSKILHESYHDQVPMTFEELESLPGVGHKTASVFLGQIHGMPAFPVDTHVHRLARRWKLSSGKSVEHTERDLKAVFPESLWSKLSLQMIFYGREFCTARGCDGKTCPLCLRLNGKGAR